MKRHVLVVIDCQNDFITGALRNEEAIKKVQKEYDRPCPIVAVCGISKPEQVDKMVHDIGLHVMFGSALPS